MVVALLLLLFSSLLTKWDNLKPKKCFPFNCLASAIMNTFHDADHIMLSLLMTTNEIIFCLYVWIICMFSYKYYYSWWKVLEKLGNWPWKYLVKWCRNPVATAPLDRQPVQAAALKNLNLKMGRIWVASAAVLLTSSCTWSMRLRIYQTNLDTWLNVFRMQVSQCVLTAIHGKR